MSRVSIRYQNGTSVEAANVHDALVHLMHTGTDYVEGVYEDAPAHEECPKCGGSGVVEGPKGKRVLTAKQAQDHVDSINVDAPVSSSSFEDRVEAVRALNLD